MAGFSRATMEQFWQRWLDANRDAERVRDWRLLADFYAPEASYGWMYTPEEHFMAIGRDEIRDYALGTEMFGLDGWHYDYVATVMDETNGMIIGFWKQRAGVHDENGREYEIAGIGGSWFGYGENGDGTGHFAWQRDWFDLNAAAKTFLAMAESGKAGQPLLDRMALHGKEQPGHYQVADLPSTIWPPVVEEADR
ncbi:nuclear transport factor 2 family protein [Saccharopolyspora sp. HNM0983]|uniref:Nuclear transport factor 2 family protein n=1 Tax=Saccharopolyspora montiporae TaxID=2781240 RepID=A0A929FYX3_9PSEU|nr:nuclear transport factor 2 family protein [Saccharopolyspora sp. HNM0983]MBE9373794.1 nuclear transport factor 2 family protein [Saccharopolyspora sp. HNM0983]